MTENHPKIAVITPYYKEPLSVLKQCHDSVKAQGDYVDHFMIADGFPLSGVNELPIKHVVLPQGHGDGGNTPRGIGGLLAEVEGYEFITYLDADNWYHPGHLRSLLDLHNQTRSPVTSSFRTFHKISGELMNITEPDEDNLRHVDTSAFLLHRSVFPILLPVWLNMPRTLGAMCDRIFLAAIRFHKIPMHSTRMRTLAYRAQYMFHYHLAHVEPGPGLKPWDFMEESMAYLRSADGIRECVERIGFWPLAYL